MDSKEEQQKEFEQTIIIAGRKRLYLSAKLSFLYEDISKEQWLNDEEVINIAKRHNIEDELNLIANCIWGDSKK